MRPSISWVWFVSALIYFLVVVWRNSWELRSVRSVLGRLLCRCIVLAIIFFLGYPYRAVHLESWFCNLPVGGWSAYRKNTNSGSCSSPVFLIVLSHSSVFSKGNVVVTCCESVKLCIHFLVLNMVRERDSVEIAVHQYEEHVLFVSNQILLLIIQMYNMSSLHKYN